MPRSTPHAASVPSEPKWTNVRVVVDTNVLVSGLLSPFGAPGVIVGRISAGALRLCFDARMWAESEDVLRRPAFPFAEDEVAALLAQVQALGELVAPEPLPFRLNDASDEPFLEVAHTAMVEYLVTGNLKHFPPSRWRGVRIVSPREFLDQYQLAE